jgi:hypothetical protein
MGDCGVRAEAREQRESGRHEGVLLSLNLVVLTIRIGAPRGISLDAWVPGRGGEASTMSRLISQVRDMVQGAAGLWRLLGLLHIDSVEVTQAVQYHQAARHLTNPADWRPDNSVPLVAGKPAWVRVYVRSGIRWPLGPRFGWIGRDIGGVIGNIEVHRRHNGFQFSPVATLVPVAPGFVTAHPDPAYATERGSVTETLNFVVPADVMCGVLRLVVSVASPSGDVWDTFTLDIDVTLRQTLRLRGIMVDYAGPASDDPGAPTVSVSAPTLADLQAVSAWALLVMPVQSAADYSTAGSITATRPVLQFPLIGLPGCSSDILALRAAAAAQVTADGHQPGVVYYTLLPAEIPTTQYVGLLRGCERAGFFGGIVGDDGDWFITAHQIGHLCGLPHAPCQSDPDPQQDPTYWTYDPYGETIGEYGLDVSTGAVMPPSIFRDMMYWCDGPPWISLRYYGRLLNNPMLNPTLDCVDYPWWPDLNGPWPPKGGRGPQTVISIIGVLDDQDGLEVTSVMRVTTRADRVAGRSTGLTAELLGAEGETLARARVRELGMNTSAGGGCDCGADEESGPRVVQALIPTSDVGARLRIRHTEGSEVVWEVSGPEREPQVGAVRASVAGDRLELAWEAASSGGGEEVWVQWSAPEIETGWRALATGLHGDHAELDASLLPAGTVSLRVLVSDGFLTATSDPVDVEVPERPPEVAILGPREGQTIVAGGPMRLWGAATTAASDDRPIKRAEWTLDGEQVADGLDTFVTAPPAGVHRLELDVADAGGEARATRSFLTVEVAQP